jgi:predicted DNA-binding antitoxin AbrB/MazE fold protein
MSITVDVVFDGEVLRPQQPVNLTPNQHYSITIDTSPKQDSGDLWDLLDSVTGSYDGPGDSSAEHDHYIYGTPKRGVTENA